MNTIKSAISFTSRWGKLGMLKGLPKILQEAAVDVYDEDTCRQSFGDVIKVRVRSNLTRCKPSTYSL